MTNKTKNFILVSPETHSLIPEGFKIFFTLPGGKRKFNLEVRSGIFAPERVGYVFYRGEYAGAFSMTPLYGKYTVLEGRPLL